MKVEIDKGSGYCFGVEFAIQMAEDELDQGKELFCLGDIVHNGMEVERLAAKGLKIITRDDLDKITDSKVLIRAHGEPPETYQRALENNIELIDASCPVVLKLQNRVKHAYDKAAKINGQVVIYGKKGHAEVVGLAGQTKEDAIIVMDDSDLDRIDFSRPVVLFSQTTKSTKGFYDLKAKIEKRMQDASGCQEVDFNANDSICRQVSNREPKLKEFSKHHDVVIFVAGRKSSNGRALFGVCESINPRSFFVESEKELKEEWFEEKDSVGICGATSTPMWLMEKVADKVSGMGEKALV